MQRRELIDLKQQLDEQAQHRIDMKNREKAEEAALARWMRDDDAKMKREKAERSAKLARETVEYRRALEGQMGEAYQRSIQPDETPFERARNTRLIAELKAAEEASPTGRKGRRGSAGGPL